MITWKNTICNHRRYFYHYTKTFKTGRLFFYPKTRKDVIPRRNHHRRSVPLRFQTITRSQPLNTTFRKDRYIYMELKFVIPNMEKTFGNLEFAGEDKTEQRRINGRMAVLSRSFNLYSDVQRADDIVVILPAEAGEKHFDFEERVKLVNPRITAEGYKIGTRGFTNYILHADDMVKA
ncbi:conserved hypothetical protein [Clostridioides difficile T3]|nr:conserved hypothetical protein [Clostridioides difficile T3]